VVEVVKKANPQAKILISLGGWADSAGDKYSRYSYSKELICFSIKLAERHSRRPFLERKPIK
jgi:GH18 family chitinase